MPTFIVIRDMKEEVKQPEVDFVNFFPGYPPDDYEGSVADWEFELNNRGFWDGKGPYHDIAIPKKDYLEMLDELENN